MLECLTLQERLSGHRLEMLLLSLVFLILPSFIRLRLPAASHTVI